LPENKILISCPKVKNMKPLGHLRGFFVYEILFYSYISRVMRKASVLLSTPKILIIRYFFLLVVLLLGCQEDVDRTPTTHIVERVPSSTSPARNPQPPLWLGTRPLPLDDQGIPISLATPPELQVRRFTISHLSSPDSSAFIGLVEPVPHRIIELSTWHEACPVIPEDLSLLTMSFWGFDNRPHLGEMLVHMSVAEDILGVFEQLYHARFPIEEMRIITRDDINAPPTGDGNVTTGFVCRSTVSFGQWSEHAFGLAVDINPFQNPYIRGDRIIPELARAYTDREWHRPGMIQPGDSVVHAFESIGWKWGGNWTGVKDWMHFSLTGR